MKKIFILLLTAGLFTACNNDKGKNNPNTNNREKDDYNDRGSKNDSDKKTAKTGDANDKDNGSVNNNNSGEWTKSEETAWMKVCADPLIKKMSEEKTQAYCSCVMEKLKLKYATYAEMNTRATYNEGVEIGKKCAQELGFNQDKDSNGENDDKNSNDDKTNYNIPTGWPQSERDDFMRNCKKEAMASGTSRLVAQSYCQCMMEKMESLYPDIKDAGRLTQLQIDRIIKRYKDKCLEEH